MQTHSQGAASKAPSNSPTRGEKEVFLNQRVGAYRFHKSLNLGFISKYNSFQHFINFLPIQITFPRFIYKHIFHYSISSLLIAFPALNFSTAESSLFLFFSEDISC